MSKTVKQRFLAMLVDHGEMARAVVTRRALGQIRQLNMVKLKRLLANLKREGLITITKDEPNRKPGARAEIIKATELAEPWLKGDK